MILSQFLKTLFEEGKVVVEEQAIEAFEEDDLRISLHNLRLRYAEDVREIPGSAPEFEADAALWAAQYFCRAVQLTVQRHLDESVVEALLVPFPGNRSAASLYAADLVFRYLPDLFRLAKGLSPRDIVVKKLSETALLWPLSTPAVSAEPDTASLQIVLEYPALRALYVDRILKLKHKKLGEHPLIAAHIRTAMGAYAEDLWPGFLNQSPEKEEKSKPL